MSSFLRTFYDSLSNLFSRRKAQLVYHDGSHEIVSVVRRGNTYWVKGRNVQLTQYGMASTDDPADNALGWFKYSGWTGKEFQ